MAVKFQYNKTSLQSLEKQLKVRERALPTIKSKESALRMEVKKAKNQANALADELKQKIESYTNMAKLWCEFDATLIEITDVELKTKKIAGVKTPILVDIVYAIKPFSIFKSPQWYLDGIELLKELSKLGIEQEVMLKKMELLEHARRKTTQKVNLFEKVQIPGYENAIRKIKRFMEDEENLSKAAQKIVKSRQVADHDE